MCANEIQNLLGLENKELNMTVIEAMENPDKIGNITKPKCMQSIIFLNFFK